MIAVNVSLTTNDAKIHLKRRVFEHILTCMGIKPVSHGSISPDALTTGIKKINRAINLGLGWEFTCDEETFIIDGEEINCEGITLDDLKANLHVMKQFAVVANDYPIEW